MDCINLAWLNLLPAMQDVIAIDMAIYEWGRGYAKVELCFVVSANV